MSVYMIIDSRVKDKEKYRQYIERVSPMVTKYGGRYHVRGENVRAFGSWKPERIIVIEFPSESHVQNWLTSTEYKAIVPLREAGADTQAILVDGYGCMSCELDMNLITRNENESDIEAISEITKAAFAKLAISNHTEQFIINALREAKALTISLVAEAEKKVVGHIAFSPVTISDGSLDWYGLGPISVLPELQKKGIGKSLMREGLSLLKSLGAKGCVLVGDPGYYQRFGFKSLPDLVVDGVPPQYFLALPFEKNNPQGTVVFHEGFNANG